jgi:diketogulonate reductase-like aldo/keto reductase
MSQVALAWINKRIASPIIGFSSVDRIDEAIEVRGKTLTEEEEKYLEKSGANVWTCLGHRHLWGPKWPDENLLIGMKTYSP